ncbi:MULTISPECIES: stressosome-associated protein Prli42 [Bacillus cereus group]
MNKNWKKVFVYVMLGSMLASTMLSAIIGIIQ